jgi:hypothetical protein
MRLEADRLGKRSECEACLSMEGPFSTGITGDAVAGDVEQRGSSDDAAPIFRTAQAQFVGARRTTFGDGRQVADQQQNRRIAVDRLAGT